MSAENESQRADPLPQFYSSSQLLRQPAQLKWAIEGLFPSNSTSLWFGDSESAKSLLAIDAMVGFSVTGKFHGIDTTHGISVLLAAEGVFGLRRRLAARLINEHCRKARHPIAVSAHGYSLLKTSNAKSMKERLLKAQDRQKLPLTFFCIDTLAKNFTDGDENSTKDISQLLANVDRYIREPFGAFVAILHHPGHSNKNRPRGSSALPAGVDTAVLCKKQDGVICLKCTHQKDAPKFAPMYFNLQKITLPEKTSSGKEDSAVILKRIIGNFNTKQFDNPVKTNQISKAQLLFDLAQRVREKRFNKFPDEYKSIREVLIPLKVLQRIARKRKVITTAKDFYKQKEKLIKKNCFKQVQQAIQIMDSPS